MRPQRKVCQAVRRLQPAPQAAKLLGLILRAFLQRLGSGPPGSLSLEARPPLPWAAGVAAGGATILLLPATKGAWRSLGKNDDRTRKGKNMRLLLFGLWASFLFLGLTACGENKPGSSTGSIVARVEWPVGFRMLARKAFLADHEVVSVRASVSGPDMATVSKVFKASDGKGTINNIPAGVNRVLLLEGLDRNGATLCECSRAEIIVLAGKSNNVGVLRMQTPYPKVALDANALTVNENGGSADFNIALGREPNGTVAVRVSTGESAPSLQVSALGNAPATSIDIVFNASNWVAPQIVTVFAMDNDIADGNREEIIVVDVLASGTSDATGYAKMTAAEVEDLTVTVQDDDGEPSAGLWDQMFWDKDNWQ